MRDLHRPEPRGARGALDDRALRLAQETPRPACLTSVSVTALPSARPLRVIQNTLAVPRRGAVIDPPPTPHHEPSGFAG